MYSLKQKLSHNGFTASESYDHAIRCFLNNPTEFIRCMNVDGRCGRRRTAFAHALAHSLEAQQVLYYEFGKDKPVPQIIRVEEGEEIIEEPPVEAFDRILTEACAQSEAAHTILILDQLHKTQFMNHIRLYEFLQTGVWRYADVQYQANLLNIKVFLVSEEPLYHSLQSCSFRLWVHDSNESRKTPSAEELGLDESECFWFEPLQSLLKALKLSPTIEEYRRLVFDIEQEVRSEQQLQVSLFGWLENVDKEALYSEEIQLYLKAVLDAVQQSLGIQEEIEIKSMPQ